MTYEHFKASRNPNALLRRIPVERIHPAVIDMLRTLEPLNCYVAGGYARWCCSEREDSPKPSDVDVIALTDEGFEKAEEAFHLEGGKISKETEFSISYKPHSLYNCPLPVQLLKNFKHRTLEAALSHIDFSVCRVALKDARSGVADLRFTEHERQGRLAVLFIDPTRINNTVCRMLRYAKKGYDISQLDVLEVLKVVKTSDLEDPGLVPKEGLSYADVAS